MITFYSHKENMDYNIRMELKKQLVINDENEIQSINTTLVLLHSFTHIVGITSCNIQNQINHR